MYMAGLFSVYAIRAPPIPPLTLNTDETPVHVIPSAEYAMELVPWPLATHFPAVQLTPVPTVANVVVPRPVHTVPL